MGHLFNARRLEWTNRQTSSRGEADDLPALSEIRGSVVVVGDRDLIFLCSNDRLGLAADPRVRKAAARAAVRFGVGLGSPFLGGRLAIHDALEERLAAFLGREAAVLFNSGYLANAGCIPALVQDSDSVIVDEYAHACIQDGMHLSRGAKHKFMHNDVGSLRTQLSHGSPEQSRLILVDGIYSMGGDFCKLPDVVTAARDFQADLIVDDAHGFGTAGHCGRGTGSYFGLDPSTHAIMGTFNKGLGGLGGFIAADRNLVEYLRHRARTVFFTAAVPPPVVAAAMTSLEIMEKEPERFEFLWGNARRLWGGIQNAGFKLYAFESPIIPIPIRDIATAKRIRGLLYDRGIFVQYVGFPAIPHGKTIIRIGAMSCFSDSQLDQVVDAFSYAKRVIGNVSPATDDSRPYQL